LASGDNVNPGPGPVQSTNDKVYSLSDPNAPAWPTAATGTSSGAASAVSAPATTSAAPAPTSTTPAPTNFTATSPSSTEVALSWTDNTKGTGTYVLQRRATHGSAGFQTIATLAAGTTSYADTSVTANWEYDYQLTAVVSGVSSSGATVHTQVQAVPAPVVTTPVVTTPVVTTPVVTTPVVSTPVVTTPVVSAPASTATTAAPTNVTVTAGGPGQITVSWSAGQGAPTIYIYPTRGAGGAAAAINLGKLAAGSTSATIGGINNRWEVIAEVSFTANGVESAKTAAPSFQVTNSTIAPSAAFAPALVTTPAVTQTTTSTAPAATSVVAAPTNLTATSPNSGEVDLSWTDNTNGAATYLLERRATNGSAGFQAIATIAAGVTTYSDVHVNPNWQYDYILTAVQSGVGSTAASVHVQVQNITAPATTTGATTTTTPVTVAATDSSTPTGAVTAPVSSTDVDPTSVDKSDAAPTYVLPVKPTNGSAGVRIVNSRPSKNTASAATSRKTTVGV
jgi:hypothetical protein